MNLKFTKYHGTGNDFIMVDNRELRWVPTIEQVKFLCSRHFGIGSDGMILIERHPNLDYYMNFFNPDGSQSFCGNGSRCAFRFAQKLEVVGADSQFEAIDGEHEAHSDKELVSISMNDVEAIEHVNDDLVLNTGSPHYIRFCENLDSVDVVGEGRAIRNMDRFGVAGINVNFVEGSGESIRMRTYERGVEDETLSCGTGVTAAALAWAFSGQADSEVKVKARGGDLKVSFSKSNEGFHNIRLIGPATEVYEGEIWVQ